ncbi:MAG: ATPase, T2SS/T4P/T4SS family [Gemmatimonadaceae bacterium]
MPPRPLRDEWLIPTLEGLLSPEQAAGLRAEAQESYWEHAVRTRAATDEAIVEALAKRFRMRVADLGLVAPQARDAVPEQLARKFRILPLAVSDSTLDVATADPNDLDAERSLAFATGRTVRMHIASPLRISERIDEVYRPESAVEKILESVTGNYEVQSVSDAAPDDDIGLGGKGNERPVIRLVDHILAEGITTRASDIHLEPEENGVAVRYRIDGVLRDSMNLPRAAGLPLVSRVKIMSGLDIADRMRPQDGRARVMVNGNRVDLRVSTLPSAHGEKVVIRVLDTKNSLLSLDSLGLAPDQRARIDRLLDTREGIILVTGPTGSGKTTTLYSTLGQLKGKGVNIITVEDPVEYRIQGVVQVQVNEKAGLTFASALRSILRQDPDVVLIGEIRDRETAQIAIQASLTGHLVFSTLHTNDAASSVTRLADIGVENYKIGNAVKGVIAQRLIRRLCPNCRQATSEPPPERTQRFLPPSVQLYRAAGCDHCAQTGYRGRLAIQEVLVTNPDVERAISAGESAERIAEAARQGGMKSLFEAGIYHIEQGTTTIEELLRVVEVPAEAPPRASEFTARVSSAPVREEPGRADENGGGSHSPRTSGPRARPLASRPATPRSAPVVGATTGDAFELVEDFAGGLKRNGGGAEAGATILLVEDEAGLRMVLRDLLEREGFRVVEAGDGVQALDEIDRAGPDVVVLDLNLPRLDGYGVLSQLRSRRHTANLPVLVLTARGDEDSEVRVFEFGANDYLAKPFRPRALSARLRSLLKRAAR